MQHVWLYDTQQSATTCICKCLGPAASSDASVRRCGHDVVAEDWPHVSGKSSVVEKFEKSVLTALGHPGSGDEARPAFPLRRNLRAGICGSGHDDMHAASDHGTRPSTRSSAV